MNKSAKTIGFLKTTAIGGLLFLLPLVVIGALVGQVVPIVLTVAEVLGDNIPFKTPGGIALLILLAIVVVLLLCFAAPVLARFDDSLRIGFEVDRSDKGLVTVYLPGAPDPWSGKVVFVNADRVEQADMEFGDAVATFEKLGRGSASLLAGKGPECS